MHSAGHAVPGATDVPPGCRTADVSAELTLMADPGSGIAAPPFVGCISYRTALPKGRG